jgi:hypothetical protein
MSGIAPARRCFQAVRIARDLHDRGEEIDNQLRQVRTDAIQYEATTNSLLARPPCQHS